MFRTWRGGLAPFGTSHTKIPRVRKAAVRRAAVERKTSETEVRVELSLDGSGRSEVQTGIPFLDHMLDQLARHGFLDLKVSAKGDLEVDFHHTVEDLGICLGKALREAIGDASGLRRFGHAQIPMDDSLVSVSMDISGRPYLVYRVATGTDRVGNFPVELVREFFRAVSTHAGITLHIHALEGQEAHHTVEATFKAFARALAEAGKRDERMKGIPSTKGSL
jgi:imidazoleglycerol-phosphate dehydratase